MVIIWELLFFLMNSWTFLVPFAPYAWHDFGVLSFHRLCL